MAVSRFDAIRGRLEALHKKKSAIRGGGPGGRDGYSAIRSPTADSRKVFAGVRTRRMDFRRCAADDRPNSAASHPSRAADRTHLLRHTATMKTTRAMRMSAAPARAMKNWGRIEAVHLVVALLARFGEHPPPPVRGQQHADDGQDYRGEFH